MKNVNSLPILFFVVIVILVGCSSEEQQSSITSGQEQKTQATHSSKAAQDTKPLLGWWKEVESWSLNFQTGQLKKDEQAFGFYREFTEQYACTVYTVNFDKPQCGANVAYTVSGNKITYGGNYEEWRIVDGKLELVGKNSKGKAFSKSVYIKVSEPTSTKLITPPPLTRPELPENPKAKLTFVKAGEIGICLRHDGGDSFSLTRIDIHIEGREVGPPLSFGQWPEVPNADYIFDSGESFIITLQSPAEFLVGDRVQARVGYQVISPLKPNDEPDYWTIEKIEPEDKSARLFGGLASCP